MSKRLITAPAFTNYPHLPGITDRRAGQRAWRSVKTAERVRWIRPPLRVYRDKLYGSALWWSRCDVCCDAYRRDAFTLQRTHAAALEAALRHARDVHGAQV